VQLAGAAGYLLLVGVVGVTFDATPLVFGTVMLVAARYRPRLIVAAAALLLWGAAVLLARHGPVPADREAALVMVAFGLAGLLMVWPRALVPPRVALEGLSVVLLAGGAAFYLAYDLPVLTDARLWAAALAVNAVVLWFAKART
jgi:glucan phosphoethanolaminetransferase (alkaline phosphatase superfamily)